MNKQYVDFRQLWIAFDLLEVSLGIWLIFFALSELALVITFTLKSKNLTLKIAMFISRIAHIYIPFYLFKGIVKDISKANAIVGYLILVTYVIELKLYNGELLKRFITFTFVKHRT